MAAGRDLASIAGELDLSGQVEDPGGLAGRVRLEGAVEDHILDPYREAVLNQHATMDIAKIMLKSFPYCRKCELFPGNLVFPK